MAAEHPYRCFGWISATASLGALWSERSSDCLAAIAIDIVPVRAQLLPPGWIIRPSFGRHARPPRTKGLGARDRPGLTDLAKPMRACRQPEMSLGANDAGPRLLDEFVELGR